jgi:FkbM family methyltransferase
MRPAPIDPPEIWNRLWADFSGDVGWDVGANCGQTIPVMQTRFNQIYAFEPARECDEYLDAFHGISVYPIALSDTNEDIELIALPDKIDTGQLVTAGTHGMEWSPALEKDGLIRKVPSCTVDHMIEACGLKPPNFMKIDTEGHELKILFGARQTLATHRPDLLIEFHSPELHDSCKTLLEQYDYNVETVRHPHYRPGTTLWFSHGWFRARQ